MKIDVYTDGGCRPTNPGPGGWAYVCVYETGGADGKEGYEPMATNQRMELTAAMEACVWLIRAGLQGRPITFYCDSKYVVEGLNTWRYKWLENGWKNSRGRQIDNYDLWSRLNNYSNCLDNVTFVHIKGHDGNKWNEIVDKRVERAITKGRKRSQKAASS